MTTLNEIIRFAELQEGFIGVKGGAERTSNVSGIKTDTEASVGDLSWISVKRLSKDPQCLSKFKGALLVTPKIDAALDSGSVFLESKKPKLLFTKIVDRFFNELTQTKFDKSGVSPDAKIGLNVTLAPGVVLGPKVVLGNDVNIGPNTVLANCTVGDETSIGANCTIGLPGFGYEKDEDGVYFRFPHLGNVVVGKRVEIGSNTCIDRGALGRTFIDDDCKIDNLVHVAHNVQIYKNSLVIANSMIGGSTVIGANSWVAPSTSIINGVEIGESSVLGMGAVVIRSVEPGQTIVGNPGKPLPVRSKT